VELGLVYRMDPLRILELAESDPFLITTMLDVAEELAG
jgi:hypothetical protein